MQRLLCALFLAFAASLSAATNSVIYCTDLFHPHDDPDDHFDLATLFALPELKVEAILLDQGDRQVKKPGAVPLRQMRRMTGQQVPFAIGLGRKLASPGDNARGQPGEYQAAVGLLLNTLRRAANPVTIVTAGSVRDVCAAWNREPALFKEKVSRLYLNLGSADPGQPEYNVGLDPNAYVGLLRSGLPLYLCCCLPMRPGGNNSLFSTWWKFRQSDLLPAMPLELQNFFIYALQRCPPEVLEPVKALGSDLRPWQPLVWEMDRNMWCTASLLHAAGRQVYRSKDGWTSSAGPSAAGEPATPFGFVPARVSVDDAGKIQWELNSPAPNLHLFKVLAPDAYGPAMRDCLRELLRAFHVEPWAVRYPLHPQKSR